MVGKASIWDTLQRGAGYATAWRRMDGRKFTTTLHRAVYYNLTGQWPEVVRHTCDNARCINPQHLIGGTHLENMQDMRERGRQGPVRGNAGQKGEDNGYCKLTDAQCEWVRLVYRKGTSQLYRIVKGEARAA